MSKIIIAILFIITGLLHLKHSLNLKNKFKEKHNIINSTITATLWVIGGILYPIVYDESNNMIINTSTITIIITPIIMILLLRKTNNKIIINKISELRRDINRKSFHLLPPALIIALWLIGGKSLMITTGYAGLMLVEIIDLARHSKHQPPAIINKILNKSIKKKELYEPLKTQPLILSLIPLLLPSIKVFITTALVSTISDGTASVIGHAFGNKKLSNNKTIIGHLSGLITTFIIVIITFTIFNSSITETIITAIIASITFLLIDITPSPIDDNILNPLIIGLVINSIKF